MPDSPLPHTVNTRKAVARAARYSGALGVQQLRSVADVLLADEGSLVRADIRFTRDDEDRQIVLVDIEAVVQLQCQRCLEPYTQAIESHSELAIVSSDEEARLLPARYEPLLAGEETDLWEVVAEELALALPVVGYHDRGMCPPSRKVPEAQNREDPDRDDGEHRSPFAALSTLLGEGSGDSGDNER